MALLLVRKRVCTCTVGGLEYSSRWPFFEAMGLVGDVWHTRLALQAYSMLLHTLPHDAEDITGFTASGKAPRLAG